MLWPSRAPTGDSVAFTSWRLGAADRSRYVYFDATATVPGRQGQGLVPRLQARPILQAILRNPMRPVFHVIRTRSPVAGRMTIRTCRAGAVHPDPDGRPVPPEIQRLAVEIAEKLGQAEALDVDTLRLEGAYAGVGGLYAEGQEPQTGDERLDGYINHHLGPDDGMLVFGQVTILDPLRLAITRLCR